MSNETKCCGNCRWWKEIDGPERGECRAPVPFSMFNRGIWIMNTDGTDCPCFAPPIPQEVLSAVKEYQSKNSNYRDAAAIVIATYAIEHMQLKGGK